MPMLDGRMVSDRWMAIVAMELTAEEARLAWGDALSGDPHEAMAEIRQCIIDGMCTLEQSGYDGAIQVALDAYEATLAGRVEKLEAL